MTILCTIDLLTREVFLPADQCIASYDHNVDVIRFQAEPIEDFSLDTSSIKIAAQGPNKARHDYAVDPSTVQIEEETGYITFDWPIPAGVTEMPIGTFKYGDKGNLIFAVCAEIISGSTVSKAWHSDDGIITVVAHLEPESGGGEDPSEEATNAQKIAQLQTDVAVINTQVGALANGSPAPVATVAEMTDESAVYLYTGSETGYTAGNWYFWNGTAWTSGGTYGGAVTDTTLSISGAPADAKAVGEALAEKADADDVGELSQLTTTAKDNLVAAINEANGAITETNGRLVNKNGTDEVTPKNLQILEKEFSPNLINMDAATDGKYITADGVEHNGNYFVTDFIPVEAGEKYVFTCEYQGNRGSAGMRFVACYDNKKTVMPSAGSNTEVSQPYTIPNGVSYIIISTYYSTAFTKYQFEKSESGTSYEPYGLLSAVIKNQYLPDTDMDKIPAFHLVDGQNLLNQSDTDYLTGKYIKRDGTTGDSANYITSGYISVIPGDTIVSSYRANSGNTDGAQIKYLAAYNSSKSAIVNSGVSAGNSCFYNVPDGIYYVRVSINKNSYTEYLQIERNHSGNTMWMPYKPYEAPHYELKESYMYPLPNAPENVYLPSDIYVAVGRTIELYNSQIVLDYEKYHFRWVCRKGKAYARKFSITGDSAGNQNLDLYLYDDKKNICWCGRCVIHVVTASNPTKKILPIGDSLTNWKAWLQETMLLSGKHITWVGTRYSGQSVDSAGNVYASGTIHHEGRSGWKASDYLANSEYTFDNRYDGVSSVSGSANPFWNGSAFSLNHYLTTQTGVDTPDAVQIFLGTNDIRNGVEPATANILSMVQTIRTEYPDMPIFICNTIYNANQNGYGSVGSDAYATSAGASAWQYEQDCLVMDLMISLKKALASITGIYIIPLAVCMDREYDFGQVMTKVNPRSDVEIPMPVERIHPQASGYYQMADLMYSFYCGVLV